MRNDESILGAQSEKQPKKMMKAEFLVALDEVNAALEKNIAKARENQIQIRAKSEELSKNIAATRKFIEAL